MRFAYQLDGGTTPLYRKYQIGAAFPTAGVPALVSAANKGGLALGSTTGAADLVGITVDAQATFVTAQQSDGSDPERQVTLVASPHAAFKALMTGSSTEGTAIVTDTETAASTTGLIVTTGTNYTNFDEGGIYGTSGANMGKSRKIITGDATNADVEVAFPADIAVGDVFMHFPFWPGEDQFVQLSTLLTEVDCSATVDTNNNNFRVIDMELNTTTNSYVHLVPFDHLFAGGGSV